MNAPRSSSARSFFLPTALAALTLGVLLGLPPAMVQAADAGFKLQDSPDKHLDILLDGRVVARYMYAYDKSDPTRLHETYKPYLHVFDAEGQGPITKGPGGAYTHHRGIFPGWSKIGFGGKSYDRWHMKGGEIVHQKFLDQKADAAQAAFTSLTHWNDEAGRPMLVEQRTMTVRRAPPPGRVLIDFVTRLQAPNGEVVLDGDPEHAGVQYRPANEVTAAETVYVFPKEDAKPTADLDYPWVGETYTLNGKQYSVVDLNSPDNPKNTRFSAYRDYGRFGAFPKGTIKSGETFVLKYRFLIVDGPMPPAGMIQKCWDEYAGVASPSPTPKTSVIPAVTKAAMKKDAKKAEPKKQDAKKAEPKKEGGK